MKTFIAFLTLFLLFGVAEAQGTGVVNPSTMEWFEPTTNADTTPLVDMSMYNIRCAGPVAPPGTAPLWSTGSYTIRGTKSATAMTPQPNSKIVFGTANSKNLAGDLGITADGQYWCFVTAVDTVGNESDVQRMGTVENPVPFARSTLKPGVPTSVKVNP